MIEFTIETSIERPVADVFAYVTDPEKLATWQTNTVSVIREGSGPLEVGSRLREVHRAPGGRELRSLVEVSEYEQDRVFALQAIEGSLKIHARITFEPAGQATRMRFTARGQPTGPMKLLAPLLRRGLRRQFVAHCAALKGVLEHGRAASTA